MAVYAKREKNTTELKEARLGLEQEFKRSWHLQGLTQNSLPALTTTGI